MAKSKLEVIKEAILKNNCPECYNQELKLEFLQRHSYNKFFHRTTSEVSHKIQCRKCESLIYPVQWTKDIERSFEYYQKTVKPESAGIRFSPLFYGLVFGIILLTGVVYYLYSSGIIQVWIG